MKIIEYHFYLDKIATCKLVEEVEHNEQTSNIPHDNITHQSTFILVGSKTNKTKSYQNVNR